MKENFILLCDFMDLCKRKKVKIFKNKNLAFLRFLVSLTVDKIKISEFVSIKTSYPSIYGAMSS